MEALPLNEPVKLPVTPPATLKLPVTTKLPDMIAEPVNGKAPTPVNWEPSPLNEPVNEPVVDRLPVVDE